MRELFMMGGLVKVSTGEPFGRFIFFANGAQIRHRRPEDQTNQALCLNLVTNAVIVWNTVYVHKSHRAPHS
jgi:TnpA family transposase